MRFYYRPQHPKASELGFVSAEDLDAIPDADPQALHAPFMVGRFYENQRTAEGHDIGSRAKRKEYMRLNGVADASDYKHAWAKAQAERDRIHAGGSFDTQRRKEAVIRAWHQVAERNRRR
jgi:hypothetical protein